MPRMDHVTQVDQVLSYDVRLVLTLLMEQINALRQRAGLAVVTPEQLRQTVRQYVREHPRSQAG